MHFFKKTGKISWCVDLLTLTLAFSLVFGILLGSRSLSTPDEARYAEIPREMLTLHDFVTPHLNGVKYFEKPPLFYWLQAIAIKLTYPAISENTTPQFAEKEPRLAQPMISEWVVRMPNALLALLGCLLLYVTGRLVFDRRAALWGAGILGTSFMYFVFARMVTLDMCLTALLSAALLTYLVAVFYPIGRWRRYFFYVAYSCSALAVLTKGLIGIIFPVVIVGVWMLLTKQWYLLRHSYLSTGCLLFLAIVLPWHLWVQQVNPEFFHFYFIEQHFLRYATTIAHRYQPGWFFVPFLLIGFLPWTLFLGQALAFNLSKYADRLARNKSLFLVVWIVFITGFFSFSQSKLIPYVLPVFPPMALLTGNYLSHNTRLRSTGVGWGIVLLPITWLCLGVVGWLALNRLPALASVSKPGSYFLALGCGVLLLSGIAANLCYWTRRVVMAFVLLGLGSVTAYLIFFTAIPRLNTASVKPLVLSVQALSKGGEKVVCYDKYYQDLPFYLNHCVLTAKITDELSFGMRHQATQAWMLDEASFWRLWRSPERVFVIMRRSVYEDLRLKRNGSFYLVATTPDSVLVSNYLSPHVSSGLMSKG